jgi:selenocysteine lyase/cysteine desulfurase
MRRINTSLVPFSANPVSSEKRQLPDLLRASLHYYNTNEEIGHFVSVLRKLL